MARIPDLEPGDELPDIGEMVDVMREVVAADEACTGAFAGGPLQPGFTDASRRLTRAITAQRALLARIDTLLNPEVSP